MDPQTRRELYARLHAEARQKEEQEEEEAAESEIASEESKPNTKNDDSGKDGATMKVQDKRKRIALEFGLPSQSPIVSMNPVVLSSDLMEQISIDIAPLGEHLQAGQQHGSSYNRNATSVPGAYSEVPYWRRSNSESANADEDLDGNSSSPQSGAVPELDSVPALAPSEDAMSNGLVQATLVSLPSERAQPLDASEAQARQERFRSYKLQILLMGICLLVLLVVGLAAGLLATSPSKDIVTDTNQTQDETATIDPMATWSWDLPFDIPNNTLHILLRDKEDTSPQSKAYNWIKQDPYFKNYTNQQLLQRYIMVTFYLSTSGESWFHQGGGNVTITADTVSTLEFFSSMGQPPPPPGRDSPKETPRPMGGLPQDHRGDGGGRLLRQLQHPPPAHSTATKEVTIASEQWLSYEHSECDWFSRASLYEDREGLCGDDDNGKYYAEVLDLMQNNLAGRLPEELGLLTTLKMFKVGRNKIGGPIPSQLGALTRLTNLMLFSNQLTGIPSELGLMSSALTALSLKGNKLRGSLPREIWQLSKLYQFMVGSNELSGGLPEDIGKQLPKLKMFMMERNQFSGTLPTSLGLLSDVVILHFDENQFTGTLPTELGQLRNNVTRLFLRDNLFTGTLPSELGQLSRLKELKVEGNTGLGGSFPSELRNLNDTLTHLFLGGTSIIGTIPSELCGIFKLKFDCSPTLCGCDCPCE